jgi:hypothetical protein|uniref:Uncharacterized protein n=1 Tax=viral metagenome TaxID=1070528 RepID=A0A6C0KPD9_9ZZZZ
MNYGAYMRKIQSQHTTTIGFQNGQDASLITMKRQARANTVTRISPLTPVPTQFSKIGGTVANNMEATQQTASPTDQSCSSGYKGFASGIRTADMAANLIGAKQNCAVCSDAPSSAPYNIVLPCKPFLDPNSYDPNPQDRNPSSTNNNNWKNPPTFPTPGNAPSTRDQLYGAGVITGNTASNSGKDSVNLAILDAQRVTDQAQQSALRTRFNLPPKLDGLRGAVYNASRN